MFLSLFLFTLATLLLFLSSQSLLKNLIRIFKKLTKKDSTTANLIFFILLPGVLIHELSHLIMAQFLQVQTGELSLKPSLEDNHLKLGSAQIALTDPFRLTLIGSAPFITGTAILWLLLTLGLSINFQAPLSLNLTQISSLPLLPLFLSAYFLFAISNTMFSSTSDLQAAIVPIIFTLIIFGIFYLLKLNLPLALTQSLSQGFTLISLIFFSTLAINLIILLPLKLINR